MSRPHPTPQAPKGSHALPPSPVGRTVLGRFFAGVRLALGGIGLVLSDRRLFALSIVPMCVHVALFAALVFVGVTFVFDPLLTALGPASANDANALVAAGHAVWSAFAHVLIFAFVVGTSLVMSVLIGSIVNDPFYDALSERTEALFVGHDVGLPFSVARMVAGIVRELLVTLLRLAIYLAVAIPLWLLSLTPAALAATPLGLAWTWLFVAFEFLARPMIRHAPEPQTRMRALFAHKAVFLGFGAVAWAMSFVPFLAPFLVVAATRAYLAIGADGSAPTSLSPGDLETLRTARAGS